MKRTFYILFLILTFSCNNTSTPENIINKTEMEKEIVDFYKFIIDKDTDSSSFIANRPGFLMMKLDSALICNDSLFSTADWKLINTQKRLFKDFIIEKTNANYINVDSILPELKKSDHLKRHWEILDNHYSGLGFYSYSLPYFNKTKDLVIIESSFNCNGLCGHGEIRVFEKKNNEWRYLKTLRKWIS